jgi:hypothetical protein
MSAEKIVLDGWYSSTRRLCSITNDYRDIAQTVYKANKTQLTFTTATAQRQRQLTSYSHLHIFIFTINWELQQSFTNSSSIISIASLLRRLFSIAKQQQKQQQQP